MKNFQIKITGSGTLSEISDALLRLMGTIDCATEEEADGAKWEDEILFTEISEEE